MATTDVAYTDLSLNAGVAQAAGTTLVAAPTNNMRIVQADLTRTVLRVTNTGGADLTFTVKAGTYPPSIAAGQGDLAVTVPATTGVRFITLESGRFTQNDGSVLLESSLTTGTVTAYRLPKGL
jgi:hypothetical protein